MSLQLSPSSFLQMLAQSGLLNDDQLRAVRKRFTDGKTPASDICEWLQKRGILTGWQSEKLLQAKHRGFFLGPYTLLQKIARGGMSSIYAARHRTTGDVHALKVLPPSRTTQASYLPRFKREAAIAQRLQHPNIVRVHGVYEETDGKDPVHFMAMELLTGRDLFEIVSQEGPMSCRRAVALIQQAALGLEYAHQNGLVHRDIKPGNLFLSDDGSLRILDLGLAQDFDSDENLTREHNERVLGTADYLAPEQAADSHTVDARADIYALGCSLYFLLTGRPPFTEGTLIQRLVAHQTKTPDAVTAFRDDVPESLLNILGCMMTKDRDHRISSAAQVTRELLQFLEATKDRPELEEPPRVLRTGSAATLAAAAGKTADSPLPMTVARMRADTHPTARDDSSPSTADLIQRLGSEDFDTFLKQLATAVENSHSLSADDRSSRLLQTIRELQADDSVTEVDSGITGTVAIALPQPSRRKPWLIAGGLVFALILAAAAYVLWTSGMIAWPHSLMNFPG
ncbi:MAG: serine/threonine-protein kinase [Planctomycetaceae bacterium]